MDQVVRWSNECLELWSGRSAAPTWFGLPWLTIECYLYVRMAAIIQQQPYLASIRFDPFASQKQAAFVKSSSSVEEIADSVLQMLARPISSPAEARDHMVNAVQYSLWGNKTDLSVLVDASNINPAALAAVSSSSSTGGGQQASNPHLILNDFALIWDHLNKLKQQRAGSNGRGGQAQAARIDIILDNAGLELYADLCLADCLVTWDFADVLVLHGKQLPWFVSDTLQADQTWTLDAASTSDSMPVKVSQCCNSALRCGIQAPP